ncbi:MAG: bacteriohemerythrin [Magnetococcales bacterium]|nr:bacteriohemerythrin [Magnetococcales bacterium]
MDKKPLLIVDDSPVNLKILVNLLQGRYPIRVATRGEEALRLAAADPTPALILLDIVMPEMDGYEVCRRLKSNERTQDIPVIFLSSLNQAQDEALGFQAGAVDYLAKPVNPALLHARVETHLTLSAYMHRLKEERRLAEHHVEEAHKERAKAQVQRQRLEDQQRVLLRITRLALRQLPLEGCLSTVLEALSSLRWLEVENTGALFLADSRGSLVLAAHRGLSRRQADRCRRIKPGQCACGQAARNRESIWMSRMTPENSALVEEESDKGRYALPLLEGERLLGVLSLGMPADHLPVDGEVGFLEEVASTLATLLGRQIAEEKVRLNRLEVQRARNDMMNRLSIAAEFRDTETGLHIVRMGKYAATIAGRLGWDEARCEEIELAAPMHDVGKIGIEDGILKKPGRLTEEEYAVMQRHGLIGATMLEGSDPLLRLAREIALTHHERWDGSGYPRRLMGEAIPLSGRICAIADVFDALTMERPYKKAWPVEQAVAYLQERSGRDFEPELVLIFLEILPEILEIKALYRDDCINPREVLPMLPVRAEAGSWAAWDPGYSVGSDVIDTHHRYLFELGNRLHAAIVGRQGVEQVGKVLHALEQYTRVHFAAEERLMHQVGYLKQESHELLHRAFERELVRFQEELFFNPLTVGEEMMLFLRDWLMAHVGKSDREILLEKN